MPKSAISPSRPRILILTLTEVARDPRPLKQLRVLKNDYDVTVAAYGESPDPDIEFIRLQRAQQSRGFAKIPGIFTALMILRQYRLHELLDSRNQGPLEHLAGREWDLVLTHDPGTLSIALALPSKKGVLLDLHEFAPDMAVKTLKWSLLHAPYYRWLCRVQAPKAKAITTVAQGIADKYYKEFGFKASVVMNATPYHDLTPSEETETIRLVHSGVAAPDRRLENLVAGVRDSHARVTLDFFVLDVFPGYIDSLRAIAQGDPRIRFNEPVSYEELVPTLNQFDVGLSIIAPTSFNYYSSLPNKFFDSVQARLGLIVGPSPEMARFVREFQFGAVTEDFSAESLTSLLDSLTLEDVSQWKARSHASASQLAGEHQTKIWSDLVAELLK